MAKIVTHPLIRQHKSRLLLLTPPPIDEYGCEESDRAKGYSEPRRNAAHTKLYADAVRQVAETFDIAVVDVWTLFMGQAGYGGGHDALPGSKSVPPNLQLRLLLHDGVSKTSEPISISTDPTFSIRGCWSKVNH